MASAIHKKVCDAIKDASHTVPTPTVPFDLEPPPMSGFPDFVQGRDPALNANDGHGGYTIAWPLEASWAKVSRLHYARICAALELLSLWARARIIVLHENGGTNGRR